MQVRALTSGQRPQWQRRFPRGRKALRGPARPSAPSGHRVGRARLPWQPGPAALGTADVVVMVSRLELRRHRDVLSFLWWALRLRREIRVVPGALGLGLAAAPLRRMFWTASAWQDAAALRQYVASPTHRDVMAAFADRMAGSQFSTATLPAADVPVNWAFVTSRV